MSISKVRVYIQRLPSAKNISLPSYMTEGSSGVDLQASLENSLEIEPGKTALIPTGIKISLPSGYEAQIRPRSGMAINYGLTVFNTPGTIDSDYRGEIKVLLINLGNKSITISPGNRIAQMVFQKVVRAVFTEVEELDNSERGEGGFGHTGI